MTKRRARRRANRTKTGKAGIMAPRAVTASELRALRSELERRLRPKIVPAGRATSRARSKRHVRRPALHWNPEPEDVQKSVAQLVLTLVEFLRRLMERQAIRRMEQKTLTPKEVEAVGVGLMKLEETIREIGKRFGLTPEDLNLDLGTLKLI